MPFYKRLKDWCVGNPIYLQGVINPIIPVSGCKKIWGFFRRVFTSVWGLVVALVLLIVAALIDWAVPWLIGMTGLG